MGVPTAVAARRHSFARRRARRSLLCYVAHAFCLCSCSSCSWFRSSRPLSPRTASTGGAAFASTARRCVRVTVRDHSTASVCSGAPASTARSPVSNVSGPTSSGMRGDSWACRTSGAERARQAASTAVDSRASCSRTSACRSRTTPLGSSTVAARFRDPDLRPGDLVFFDAVGHVGLYIGSGRFIHAPHSGTRVSVAPLAGWYGRSFDGARRVIVG